MGAAVRPLMAAWFALMAAMGSLSSPTRSKISDIPPELQACLSGAGSDLLCTLQTDNDDLRFTVDPLLQARYLHANGTPNPWLKQAPSVFPDQEITLAASVGGFVSGKQASATAYIDYLWCSEKTCDTIMDIAWLWDNRTGACEPHVALAALGDSSLAGFGLPHSVGVPKHEYEWEDMHTLARTKRSISRNKRRCNVSPRTDPEFPSIYVAGGINVGLTLSTARLMANDPMPVAAHLGIGPGGRCTAFVFPNSAFYASARIMDYFQQCDGPAEETILLEQVLTDSRVTWKPSHASETTLSTHNSIRYEVAEVPYSYAIVGMDCRVLEGPNARTSTNETCLPRIDEGCRFRLEVGDFAMAALNLTATKVQDKIWYPTDSGWGTYGGQYWQGGPKGEIDSLFTMSLVRAMSEGKVKLPINCNFYGPDGEDRVKTLVEPGDCCRDSCPVETLRNAASDHFCNLTAYVDQDPIPQTPQEFFRQATRTKWMMDTRVGGVHGTNFFPGEWWEAHKAKLVSVLERDVVGALDLELTKVMSDIDTTFKWPAATFVLLISITAAFAACHQGLELDEKLEAMDKPTALRAALRLSLLLLVSCWALLPIVFAALGDYSTFTTNGDGLSTITYTQLSVTGTPANSYHPLGGDGDKTVALVAMEASYTTSFTAVGVIYIVTLATTALLVTAFNLPVLWAVVEHMFSGCASATSGCCWGLVSRRRLADL